MYVHMYLRRTDINAFSPPTHARTHISYYIHSHILSRTHGQTDVFELKNVTFRTNSPDGQTDGRTDQVNDRVI